ncbi:MAG TPA: HAD-IIIC family phosphatase [Anaerolineae bacterium]|nr:HAD-IIIC family phosphatase [Anaerolineae bacterium]
MSHYKCLCISDFNIDNLAGYLNNQVQPSVSTTVAPYGQVIQTLMNEQAEYWQEKFNLALVWTQPHNVIKAFQHALNYENISLEKVLDEVDTFASVLLNAAGRVDFMLVPSWVIPSYNRGYGMLDLKPGIGLNHMLMHMNLRLAERLSQANNVFMLNTQRWIEVAGRQAFNPKLWYMAKVPFGNPVFKEAVNDIKAALAGISGQTKKLVIVDLDDTLWGGIVGDLGWENISLGGHDLAGEAFVDFQTALKSLTNRGLVLGIVSKNSEEVALTAIKNHPEMVLKIDDFAGWRINWQDKAQNVADLVTELNLGLQSVVFIDDNPVERARVREALPEVFVPEWPADKSLYTKTLMELTCFDTASISHEDKSRAEMYVTERKRNDLRQQMGSLDDWLKTLEISVKVEPLNPTNLPRTAQLLNKTNQMNLSTRRMTETELQAWLESGDRQLWTFRVADRFGDSGLTGIISLDVVDGAGQIIDFILSCRVMGRKVEETMLATAVNYAQSIGLKHVYAQYIPTAKNKPCLEFWQRSGFEQNGQNDTFMWNAANCYCVPEHVTIQTEEA